MARTSVWRSAVVAAGAAASLAAGCRESLTTPGACPGVCPGQGVQLADTVLVTPVVFDTSVRGYVLAREASYLLASSLDSLKSVVAIRFSAVPDKWFPSSSDTVGVAVGAVDSILVVVHVSQRDTTVKPLRAVFYRLPAQFDTGATYDTLQPYFTDAALLDTLDIPDSVATGVVSFRLPDTLRAPQADSGVISVAMAVVGPSPTALGLESGNFGTSAPVLEYFVRGQPPNDTLTKVLSEAPEFSTFVMSPDPGQPVAGDLAVGGIPTARATLRLVLPPEAVDSSAIVRGTLTLRLRRPASGFAGDSFYVAARPLLRDYGVKSVAYPDSSVAAVALVHEGDTGSVALEIAPILRLWGTTTGDTLPRVISLSIFPEGQVLGQVDFEGGLAGALAPQLRVTYVRRYTFGLP
jgi:hypothetical protein